MKITIYDNNNLDHLDIMSNFKLSEIKDYTNKEDVNLF
jgi:hypothetical protein